jgi:tRNA(fMet)-specific endonuclease VapC
LIVRERYLIDTDWLIDARVGRPAAVRAIDESSDEALAVSIVSCGELYEGAFEFPDPKAELLRIRTFLEPFAVVPLTDPIMEIFGRTRSELRRTGQLIPDFDLLIAATAVHHDLNLLTRNLRHFARIPDLRIYSSH